MNIATLAERIVSAAKGERRYLVAIAGPPGAGKSTLAEELHRLVAGMAGKESCAVVPMDGFHFDNAELDKMGLRHRKGAPQTFDAKGFAVLVDQIRSDNKSVAIPGFDREADAVIHEAFHLDPAVRIVLFEGNYLLLDEPPWSNLEPAFDLTVFINPGLDVLKERLVRRWLDHGLPPDAAADRVMSNDFPNAGHVIRQSRSADINLQ